MSTENGDHKESVVVCETHQGVAIRATLLHLTRFAVVFEVYSPALVLRASEVLGEFQIMVGERAIYSGRAVVRNVVDAALVTVCEAALTESAWRDVDFTVEMLRTGKLRTQFQEFIQGWQKLYKLLPEYKVIIADMQSYLSDLRLWLDQVELGIRSSPSEDRVRLENEVSEELAGSIIPCVDVLFEKFERIAERLEEDLVPAHRNYMRRQLHPLVLCAPFAYRTFQKPLGYAGDYEMVNMILRNKHEGGSLFAKAVNTWFLRQAPAQAHRNRIAFLTETLQTETLRVQRESRSARIFSVACGPCQEVDRFLNQTPLSDHARFTLLDFNEETLQYARSALSAARDRHGRRTQIDYVRKSVQQMLKEKGKATTQPDMQYDFVYCAGLFDYLSDQMCRRLMDIMYEWVAPNGLLVATNVEPSNPMRNGMEFLLDWHLVYRKAPQMLALAPARAPADASVVRADDTGVNLFLEVRKPDHV